MAVFIPAEGINNIQAAVIWDSPVRDSSNFRIIIVIFPESKSERSA